MYFKSLKSKCNYYRDLVDYRLLPNTPVIAMVDGHCFSKLIKNYMKKPFDDDFIRMMDETAKYVCQNIQGCKFAYVQSDEISFLLTDYDTTETDSFFGYRLCKMHSIIASLATSKFNQLFTQFQLKNSEFGIDQTFDNLKLAEFDCKVWSVPNENDAFAWFLWRQNDCVRNSKQQAAQTYLSHKTLLNKNTDVQIEMLKEQCGIDWNTDYSDGKKYGRVIMKVPGTITKLVPRKLNGVTLMESVTFEREIWTAVGANPFNEWCGNDGNNFLRNLIPNKNEKN